MPIRSLIEQEKMTSDMTAILTTAFDSAWDEFKTSGSALAGDGCAPSTRALLAKLEKRLAHCAHIRKSAMRIARQASMNNLRQLGR